MKTTFKIATLVFTSMILSGCWLVDDKGAVEIPPSGEGDFAVVNPPQEEAPETIPNPDIPVVPPSEGEPPENQTEFGFIINNGDVYSNEETLKLQFSTVYPLFREIKVSPNNSCEGGTFEPIVPEKTVSNFAANTRVSYSVVFKDVDGIRSNCLSDSIIHDNMGPDILFTKYPMGSIDQNRNHEIQFTVSDISPILDVKCRLNDIERACLSGANQILLNSMSVGNYVFTVEARDIHEHISTKTIQWSVVNSVRFLSQNVVIREDKKVDILIVVDNSGSMSFEQRNMSERVRNMLSILRGFDYRIAVTTTDPNPTRTSSGRTYTGDGDLIPISGQNGALWIGSDLDETVAQNALGLTIQRSETGSGSEQGIRSVYRFVEKATTPGLVQSNFFRDGANFATLVISDEDESANTNKNDPLTLLNLISTKFNNQKAFSFHSIITKPGDVVCRNGEGATYGNRYKTMTDLTGGVMGSVCEADYASQVNGISTAIRDLVKQLTLSCEPLSQYPIAITKDGIPFIATYTVEGVNLKFNEALPAGDFKINYACLR